MAEKKTIMDWHNQSDAFSGRISESVRQLSFAGLGILWVIREYNHMDINTFLSYFLLPIFLFVCTLMADFAQYLTGYFLTEAIVEGFESDITAKRRTIDDDFTADPGYIEKIKIPFFTKIALLIISYIVMIGTTIMALSDYSY